MSLLLLIYCNFKISWFCFFAHYDIILFSFLTLMFYHYSALSSHTAAAECTFRNVLICHLGHQLPQHIPTTIQSNDLVNWVVLLLKLKFLSTAMFLNVTNLKNWDTDVAEHHKGSDVCFLSDLSIGRWRKDKASWWFSLVGLSALRLLAGIRHGIQLYRNLGTERARTCAISRTTAERNVEETGSPCFFWELSIKTEVMMILLNE